MSCHHPLFSASDGRNNEELRALWKPVFDKYQVDLSLQGHDHSYARGHVDPSGENRVTGVNTRDATGTVYVVSVSGGKMYNLRPNGWDDFPEATRNRAAENTQLFQVIRVSGDTLSYEAYTATGDLYDAFDLIKPANGGPNRMVDRQQEAIPARRHDNTVAYEDELPEAIKNDVLARYPTYEFDGIRYVDDPDFNGYRVQLENSDSEVNLTIGLDGEILDEVVEAN